MYKVIIEKECGCVRRANMAVESTFAEKDDALIHASEIARQMNDDFCGKHHFAVREEGEDLLVTVQMRG